MVLATFTTLIIVNKIITRLFYRLRLEQRSGDGLTVLPEDYKRYLA